MLPIRLNKFIADAGVSSRRSADDLIARGKVRVNGRIMRELGVKIDPVSDTVEVNGAPLTPPPNGKKFVYIMLNKPKGFVCTARQFEGEKNVLELVSVPERIFPVGRLDKYSEGLLILTNDGDLTNQLTHPRYEHEKEYLVEVNRVMPESDVSAIQRGISVEGEMLPVAHISAQGKELTIILTEGKKRHIRRVLESLGYRVERLTRVRVGKLLLGNLHLGTWKYIERKDIT